MKIVACVDHSMGLCFHHRRVSRDQMVIDQIQAIHPLYVSPYSKDLFSSGIVTNDWHALLSTDTFLVEDRIPDESLVSEIILYRWNRDYPSDIKLPYDLSKWTCIASQDFVGRSHDTITKQRYIR